MADAFDGAVAAGDSVAITRLASWLVAKLEPKGLRRPVEDLGEGVTASDDDDRPRDSLDDQYAQLCAELGDSAES